MQILANQAPIGFEAEFINQRGAAILYRGILLPFSSDDDTIDFIYGVINWKEMADAATADELLLEIDQALHDTAPVDETGCDAPVADKPLIAKPAAAQRISDAHAPLDQADLPQKHHRDPVTQWSDSPLEEMGNSPFDAAHAEMAERREGKFQDPEMRDNIADFNAGASQSQIGFGPNGLSAFTDADLDNEEPTADQPTPDFGQYHLDEPEVDEFGDEILDDEGEDRGYSFASLADYIEAPNKKVVDLDAQRFDPEDYRVDHEDAPIPTAFDPPADAEDEPATKAEK